MKTCHTVPHEAIYYREKKKQGQISDLKFHKTYVCEEDQSKALDISSATARVAQDLLKALVILSDTTVRRSAVDLEGLKPYWEPEKKPHFSR